MACNSCKKKKDLSLIRNLAIKCSKINKQDIQIYKNINGYNFEPINSKRINVIEIIKWVKE